MFSDCFEDERERYKPEYSMFKFGVKEKSLDPSSNPRRFDIKPGGNEPGPEEMAYAYLKRPFPFQATEHASAEWRVPVPNLCLTGKQRAGMESV